MPPLLAALLMIELGCDLRIVRAIDLGMEWRRRWLVFFQGRDVKCDLLCLFEAALIRIVALGNLLAA